MAARSRLSKTLVWVLLGLLFAGLAGFGATNLSGTVRTVGHAGDQLISVDEFARELQRQSSALARQTGEAVSSARLQELGIDQIILQQLATTAAIDHESEQIGLSIGDQSLQRELTEISAFQGLDGNFDRDSYRFALQNAGLTEAEFEADLRKEITRGLLQEAITSGVAMPATLVDVFVEFVGGRRTFTWASLDESHLTSEVPEATEVELRAYYEANLDDYILPEKKLLTYVQLTPDDVVDSIEIDDAALRNAYEVRRDEFNQPERRLVERLVFRDTTRASEAKAGVTEGATSFDDLVIKRGLELADVDLGDVTRSDLGEAADIVFAAEVGDIIGPQPSPLGPALFRVNGILDEQISTFDDVLQELHDDLARDSAIRKIATLSEEYENLLAAGATLEELADETEISLGEIEWTEASLDGIAAYPSFRETAALITLDDFPEIAFTDDGGLYAVRLNEIRPSEPEAFESAKEKVILDQRQHTIEKALEAQITPLLGQLENADDFSVLGVDAQVETNFMRSAFLDDAPASLIEQVFQMTQGEVSVLPVGGEIFLVRLDNVQKAEVTGNIAQLRTEMVSQLDASLAQELFTAYVQDVVVRTQPQIDQQAVNAVLSSLP
ncbi:MAG: peptidyl-prolyl cis-trans isomerase [Aestuariivita sp.]|nr:peptidyl-prolyl cis-trans isomerase [Aestuariivita sp.]MCY4203079.1 peptidyl-prolyl cis-trans isomerase [Aestuariivita sp.]